MGKRQKKSGNKIGTTSIINLIAAITSLVTALLILIDKLTS